MSTKSNNCVIQYTFARAPQILPALGTLQVKNFQDLCLVLDPMLQAAVGLLLFRSSGFARFDMSIGLYRCIPAEKFCYFAYISSSDPVDHVCFFCASAAGGGGGQYQL